MSTLILSKKSEKDFAKLPKSEQKKVVKKLKTIQVNPLLGKHLTGELKDFYSLKAWPYRIIYEFDKKQDQTIWHKIEHRQGVYKK